MKKIVISLVLIMIAIGVITGLVVVRKIDTIENTVLNLPSSVALTVESGSNLYQVKNQLSVYADIDDIGFRLWLKLNPQYTDIQAGTYEITPNMSLVQVIQMLVGGTVKQLSVTLVEGLTIKQWLVHLSKQEQLIIDVTEQTALYSRLVKSEESFCDNVHKSLEGCLLPNTYFYTPNSKMSEILQRAYSAMQKKVEYYWLKRFIDIPIKSQYEALILASIIEKETAIESERDVISGVFMNRLEKNMRLQTDPTVIYGIGDEFDGNITRTHLRTATPYNTYVIKGLPITPIAMPGEASIMASMQPAITDALYFVASGDGGHTFSTNLADHNKAVRAYLKKTNP